MQKVKEKKCAVCLEKFTPRLTTQRVCSPKCAHIFAKEKIEKKEKANWEKEKKIRKEKLMSRSEWLNICQKVFNTYIRMKEQNEACISCGTKANVQYAAGHFFSVGAFPNVRFDEDNVHKQCNNYCNCKLSGNIVNYRPALIKKIGQKRFDELEFRARNGELKLSIPEIKEKIVEYKQKIKNLKCTPSTR